MICKRCDNPFSHDYRTGRHPKYCEPCRPIAYNEGRKASKYQNHPVYRGKESWQYPCREFLAWITRPLGACNE